jgi:site-specific DNA-methyltransferase (adenine-specific)
MPARRLKRKGSRESPKGVVAKNRVARVDDLPKPDFELPGIALYNRDCRQILARVRPRSVHAIVSDPPFGTTKVELDHFTTDAGWFSLAERVTDDRACIALFACGIFTARLLAEQRKLYRYKWVWHRLGAPTGHLDCNHRPLRSHEDILVFSRRGRGPRYYPVKRPAALQIVRYTGRNKGGKVYGGADRLRGEFRSRTRHPTDVLAVHAVSRKGRLTPFQKPLDLVEFLVRSYSRRGQLVADFFFGSGTTALACLRTGRRFIGCELNPQLFRAACKRLDAAHRARDNAI